MRGNGPDVSKVYTCNFCKSYSYWTRATPDQAMYCLRCRCGFCLGLNAFRTTEEGELNVYCPACERAGVGEGAIPN